jgi:D-glycerate 3-kinase
MTKRMTISDALLECLGAAMNAPETPRVIMLSGAQGIGKSTALKTLEQAYPDRLVTLSLDDFYLTHRERKLLANEVHSLCATRGPPGTHDLEMLNHVIDLILNSQEKRDIALPVFSKQQDDRLQTSKTLKLAAGHKTILLEGWLLGAHADLAASRDGPINDLEANEDAGGIWRDWQEHHLAGSYAALWARADLFCHLTTSSFDNVSAWRRQQEATTLGYQPKDLPPERQRWVARFIKHYERITRRMIDGCRENGVSVAVSKDRNVYSGYRQ